MYLYKKLCKSDVEFLDIERSKPKVIKKYKYDKECYLWEGIICPILLFLGGYSLFSDDYIIGMILIISGIIFGLLILWLETERSSFRKKLKKAKKYGKGFHGKIRAYKIHAEENFIHVKGATGRDIKLKYILEIEIEEKRKIIQTLELKYNPTSVLKSNQCMVYQYENEYYALDFDLRSRRKDETAKIPRNKIIIGYG